MKVLAALGLAVVAGFALATVSFAECAQHKTAVVTPPSPPVASTSKT
jgi:hypothetical protein